MYKYTKEDVFHLRNTTKVPLPDIILSKIELIRKNTIPTKQIHYVEKKNYKFRSNLIQADKQNFELEINSILNKISNNNTDSVVQSLFKVQEKYDILNGYGIITEAIFNTSIKHSHFCKNYVHILVFLKEDSILEEKKQIYNKFIFEDNDKPIKLGFTNFIAQLYNFNLLSNDFLKYTLLDILKHIDDNNEYIDILHILHSKVDDKTFINPIIEKSVHHFIECKHIPSKLKFKLMDIKDTF